MNKLLVICGPTATGKTRLALRLARKFAGELVSADSRQVYRGLDIATGKDLPLLGRVKLWGLDLVSPKEEFSVAQYLKFTRSVLEDILRRKKLPILVGGTGLYLKAVVDGLSTVNIPPNKKLRRSLEKKSVAELYAILAQFDCLKAASMNSSDSHNPRRLIRAIEVAQAKDKKLVAQKQSFSVLFLGLAAPANYLRGQITKRTKKMLREGILEEIKGLLRVGVAWENQSMQTIGYQEWQPYFEGQKKNRDQVVKTWIANQLAYVRSQLVWFKKDQRIKWFDVAQEGFEEEVETVVKKWYKEDSD